MFLRFDENGPLGFVDDRVFSEIAEPKIVEKIQIQRRGQICWCGATGLNEQGNAVPALARKVQDSGEGICLLVYGGAWGVRLQDPSGETWVEPFLLLPASGEDVKWSGD